ncbi:ATP-dependent DNA ligase [Aliifodinibius sp. S!AR15-10]|uniref:ATP-dependent DNA ligase n=1 Tax=Aliifodinibius sp. S!AR15-10 TaxID=2950437 RepID=UPI002863A88C|nr:ATP-dependent DNA ligase [Aliifodinibius sp. S!AR15-10]MDR8392792.1 ATP-dependent DNA ligase [Aliifodinibius sp. S!AR15-10]
MNNSFQQLAETAQQIAETRSTNSKIAICVTYFRSLEDEDDLSLAAQFLGEGAFSSISGKRASVGSRTYSTCASDFCEIDYEKVFKPCRTALGSSSEAIEKLMQNIEEARVKRSPAELSLQQVKESYEELYRVSSREDKQKNLRDTWTQMTPVEIKYYIRIMSQGSLRIGFEIRSVVSAIAEAFDKKVEDVRYAHMITGSVGRTAVLSRNNSLDEANFKLFHPLSFMLASPIESRAVDSLEGYIAEEKFDGMRSQMHVSGQKVELYSRDLNHITYSFPEIVQFFASRGLPDIVLDGEICVFKENEILPFQLLQKRMGRKKPGKKVMEKYPVLFISYDLLYLRNNPVFDLTLRERRGHLKELSETYEFPITNQFEVNGHKHVDELFERALAHGNEGLMLKKKESTYEYGQRRKSWLKVKKPGGTLDTVLMYAHAGSGKRGGYYSDFTLGISVKEDERYEEEFIPIGKAYGGYTDEEMKRLNERIKDLTVEKYGPTLGLIPEIVVELEFDDIQVNKRTKANYTLRLPRFKAIRWDLSPRDVDTLRDVERMYQQKIERDRLKQAENPSFHFSGQ